MGASKTGPGTQILKRGDATPTLSLLRSKLVVIEGEDRGKEILFDRPSLRIGSSDRCDIVLSDPAISAEHCEILLDDQGVLLRDLGSTNGTHADDFRVREVYLNDGARISIGGTVLRFALMPGKIEIPLSQKTNFGELLGHSVALRAVFAVLERAAKTESTVLILGESGTGKELAARALHHQSPRRDGPYVVCDCGSIAPTLMESQLFGHKKGSFTGAIDDRAGLFEDASGGTLVLDEIGELPLDLQPKLLRAVEARTVQRIGETKVRPIDVRLIASTNRNLEDETKKGRFREDLYFRLSVIGVTLPPLRKRKEEIPRLVAHFLQRMGADRRIPESVLSILQSYDWPGNIRELRNVVERLVVLPDLDPRALLPGAQIDPQSAPQVPDTTLPFHEAKRLWIERFDRDYLERLLERFGGNISEAARASGLSRQSCHRLIEKHGLRIK